MDPNQFTQDMQTLAEKRGLGLPVETGDPARWNENDRGQIKISVGRYRGHVVINFGQPTQAVAFTPEQARDIANLLKTHAGLLDEQTRFPPRKKARGHGSGPQAHPASGEE